METVKYVMKFKNKTVQEDTYFAVRSAVVIDEGSRSKPELGTVLTT